MGRGKKPMDTVAALDALVETDLSDVSNDDTPIHGRGSGHSSHGHGHKKHHAHPNSHASNPRNPPAHIPKSPSAGSHNNHGQHDGNFKLRIRDKRSEEEAEKGVVTCRSFCKGEGKYDLFLPLEAINLFLTWAMLWYVFHAVSLEGNSDGYITDGSATGFAGAGRWMWNGLVGGKSMMVAGVKQWYNDTFIKFFTVACVLVTFCSIYSAVVVSIMKSKSQLPIVVILKGISGLAFIVTFVCVMAQPGAPMHLVKFGRVTQMDVGWQVKAVCLVLGVFNLASGAGLWIFFIDRFDRAKRRRKNILKRINDMENGKNWSKEGSVEYRYSEDDIGFETDEERQSIAAHKNKRYGNRYRNSRIQNYDSDTSTDSEDERPLAGGSSAASATATNQHLKIDTNAPPVGIPSAYTYNYGTLYGQQSYTTPPSNNPQIVISPPTPGTGGAPGSAAVTRHIVNVPAPPPGSPAVKTRIVIKSPMHQQAVGASPMKAQVRIVSPSPRKLIV